MRKLQTLLFARSARIHMSRENNAYELRGVVTLWSEVESVSL